jgi:hypothetical protein
MGRKILSIPLREAREITNLSILVELAHILLFSFDRLPVRPFEKHLLTICEAGGRNDNQIHLSLLSEKKPGPGETSHGFPVPPRLHNPKRSIHE